MACFYPCLWLSTRYIADGPGQRIGLGREVKVEESFCRLISVVEKVNLMGIFWVCFVRGTLALFKVFFITQAMSEVFVYFRIFEF